MDESMLSLTDEVDQFHLKHLFKNAAVHIMHYIIWFTENVIMNRISGT